MKKTLNDFYSKCGAAIGSMTQAIKAQKALAESAIPAEVQKSSSKLGRGCVYGVSFFCAQRENVENIFARYGIKVREWVRE